MTKSPMPVPLVFWRSVTKPRAGAGMAERAIPRGQADHRARHIAKVQYGWPVGLPLCRPLSGGLWEVRATLPSNRQARIFFGFHDGMLVVLHAIMKKTQKTSAEDLALARQRFKELQSWQRKTPT